MDKGITVVVNGMGFWFEDYEELYQLLDENCDDANSNLEVKNGIIWDNE